MHFGGVVFITYRDFLGLPEGTAHSGPLLELRSPVAHLLPNATWGHLLGGIVKWLGRSDHPEDVVTLSLDTVEWIIVDAMSTLKMNHEQFTYEGWLNWETVLDDRYWRLFVEAIYAHCIASTDGITPHLMQGAASVVMGNAAIIAAAYPQKGLAGDQAELVLREAIEWAAQHYLERRAS